MLARTLSLALAAAFLTLAWEAAGHRAQPRREPSPSSIAPRRTPEIAPEPTPQGR